jgi:regulation of enolase protein 1 (concanavalin A-like superfamily)
MTEQDIWNAAHWLNEPAEWHREPDGRAIIVSDPQTDFWRLTHDGGIRHSGHLFGVDMAGDFVVEIAVHGSYRTQYDQAGLMACAGETRWVKAGIEFFEGLPRLSCVVTDQTSDWSTGQAASWDPVWVRLQRSGAELAVSFSGDGIAYALARQCTFTEEPVQVGPFCCSPGRGRFEATFGHFSLKRP